MVAAIHLDFSFQLLQYSKKKMEEARRCITCVWEVYFGCCDP